MLFASTSSGGIMPALRKLQASFLNDIYTGSRASADHLADSSTSARLGIYHNNTVLTLCDLLADTYPVAARITGIGFFRTMAHHYLKAHPPSQGNRHSFGRALANFLGQYEPARSLSYLPDVTQIEWARFQAHLADDAIVFTLDDLAALSAAGNYDFRLALHPAASLLELSTNALEIWQAHQQEIVSPVILRTEKSACLIWRDPVCDIFMCPVSAAMVSFIRASQSGLGFVQALETTAADIEAFQSEFAALVSRGVFVQIGGISS